MKQHSDGTIERYKEKLVIRKDIQREGLDYNKTLSPDVKMARIKYLIAIVIKRDRSIS